MGRREFLAVAPALTSACGRVVTPATPTAVAQTTAPELPPSLPPATPIPTPAPPIGPANVLSEVLARVDGNELVVEVEGTALQEIGALACTDGVVSGLYRYVLLGRIDANRIRALNGICTHQGCIISRVAGPALECPCHGSQYDQNGIVLRGPATAALPLLATTFDGVTLRVRV
jgi:Rieske Fe-S protein